MSKVRDFVILGILGLLLIISPIIICVCKNWLKEIDDCCKLLFIIILVLIFITFVILFIFVWRRRSIDKLIDYSLSKFDENKINEINLIVKGKKILNIKNLDNNLDDENKSLIKITLKPKKYISIEIDNHSKSLSKKNRRRKIENSATNW